MKTGVKLIVGLGNPGKAYQNTRHNVGRQLVETIASRSRLTLSKKKSLQASFFTLNWEGRNVALAWPEVYMNLSGASVGTLARHFHINPKKDLLIVVDDIALPFGRLRLRPGGSDGGHNGLKSVHETLGHSDFSRLRVGIGRPAEKKEMKDGEEETSLLQRYVLAPFSPQEEKLLQSVLDAAFEACRLWVVKTMDQAMNAVNAKKTTG